MRRPVLSLNYGGEIESLVREHDLGWSVHADRPADVESALRTLLALQANRPGYETSPRDFDRYAFPSLANRYLELLGSLG